jgi:hypothetical protein
MSKLLEGYEAHGARGVAEFRGIDVSERVQGELLAELWAWREATDTAPRERPKISATGYMILRSPLEFTVASGAKAQLAAAKLARFQRLWDVARVAMEEVNPGFANVYTAIAFTYQFRGSPHIDTQNIGPFMAISLGDYPRGPSNSKHHTAP